MRRKRRRRSERTTPRAVLIRQTLIGGAVITSLALLGTGIWFGSRIEALSITTIAVTGGETVSHEEIRAAAKAELVGTYVALIPHRFAWLYPEETIEAAVRGIDRVKDARVLRRSGTEIEISFTEYRPTMLWCNMDTNASCVFVDEAGYAFEEAPALAGDTFVRYRDPERVPALREHVVSKEKSETIQYFKTALRAGWGLSLVMVEQSAPDEMELHLAEGSMLKISERVPAAETLTNLETVLSSDAFRHLADGAFEYIDLRYGNRVFVNEIEDAEPEIEVATSSPAD